MNPVVLEVISQENLLTNKSEENLIKIVIIQIKLVNKTIQIKKIWNKNMFQENKGIKQISFFNLSSFDVVSVFFKLNM